MEPTSPTAVESAAVDSAIAAIDAAVDAGQRAPGTDALARAQGISATRFRRAFEARIGLSPKAYADARRAERLRSALVAGEPVVDALYGAGYGSTSRVYERSEQLLGMTPAAYRRGAPGETVRYALADSSLGLLVVGLTDRGVCLVAFGESSEQLVGEVSRRFPQATVEPAGPADEALVASVVALVDDPSHGSGLPLDVRGTAFQQRVWRALRDIAPGETVTYRELARRIGKPSAMRAVAQACGANPLAVAVPCHRVVGSDGSLTGYRWGIERKRALLDRERVGSGTSHHTPPAR